MNFLKSLWAKFLAYFNKPVSNPIPVVSNPVTPVAPVDTRVPAIPIQNKPTNQAEWDAYRASLPASTRAYVPEVFNPNADAAGRPIVDEGRVDTTPRRFPEAWDGAPLRQVVDLIAKEKTILADGTEAMVQKVYTLHFKGGIGSVTVSPTAADPAGQSARYQVTVRSNGAPFTYGAPSPHKFVPFNVLPGDCSIDISSDVNSQAWLELK